MKKDQMKGVNMKPEMKWEDTGFCSYCLMTLEAKQPGGRDVRHKSTHTPYGQCNQAKQAIKAKKA